MSLGFVLHVFNEELILGHWLEHHKKYFEDGVIIDHHSTDRTREIAEASGYNVVTSELENFDAILNDHEVMRHEETLRTKWKMAFNVTEFLFTPPDFLESFLSCFEKLYPDYEAIGFLPVCLVDKEPSPIEAPLFKGRTHGFIDYEGRRGYRYLHKCQNGAYKTGRHGTLLRSFIPPPPHLFLLHFTFSPWPEARDRKYQIQGRVPISDLNQNRGKHHIYNSLEDLEKKRLDFLKLSANLLDDAIFKAIYDDMLGVYGKTLAY